MRLFKYLDVVTTGMQEKVGTEKVETPVGYLLCVKADGYVYAVPRKTNPKGAAYRVGKEKIVKAPGYLYYIKDGYVYRAAMKNAKK